MIDTKKVLVEDILKNITKGYSKHSVAKLIKEKKINGLFHVTDGASKICIIPKNENFVIKWTEGGDSWDECLDEVNFYKKAVSVNLGKFFPKTELFFKVNGINFVIQQKVDNSCGSTSYKTDHKYEYISRTATMKMMRKMNKGFYIKDCSYNRNLDKLWAQMALVLYGKKACKALCNFIQENRINDLHEGNLGYINNKPVILDFSGYHR